jgi:hypothetical protein
VPPFTGSRLPGRWVEVDDSIKLGRAHVSTDNVVQGQCGRTATDSSQQNG